MAQRWNMYGTSRLGDASEGLERGGKQNSAMFTKFRLDSEPTPHTPIRESLESISRVSWSRSPTAHYLPPIQNQYIMHSERQSQLPHLEPWWNPIDTPNQYQPSRYSAPHQPSYTYNNEYHTPAPMIAQFQQRSLGFRPTSEAEMMPPPQNRAASTVCITIHRRSTLPRCATTPTWTQKIASKISVTGITNTWKAPRRQGRFITCWDL